jgi:hypothetical protein
MGKRKRYSAELQEQLVRLVPAGRTPEELEKEFEPSGAGDSELGQADGAR